MTAILRARAASFARSTVTRALVAALVGLGFLTLAAPAMASGTGVPAEANPAAAPKNSQISLAVDQVGPGTARITGRLQNSEGRGIAGAVTLAVDGRTIGVVGSQGDGSFGAQVPGIPDGRHTATAVFAGSASDRRSSVRADFTIVSAAPPTQPPTQPPSKAPKTTEAPPPPAPGATSISARVTPTSATAGSSVEVTGTLVSAANVPIGQARIEVTSSWGGAAAVAATNSSGGFSALLGLPPVPDGETPPATISIVVLYPGDGPYSASRSTSQIQLLAPDAAPAPSIRPETVAPPATRASGGSSSAPAGSNIVDIDLQGAAGRGLASVMLIVGVGAVAALTAMAAAAWRRNQLLPGERRGFGTDFGK